jgi:hypothetical protein
MFIDDIHTSLDASEDYQIRVTQLYKTGIGSEIALDNVLCECRLNIDRVWVTLLHNLYSTVYAHNN